uniref:Uncharacterized protein n=2 Tax=Stomoxys calcitrans TaxID=35570 RepID=A0A1I8PNE4_STOCA
MFEEDLNINNGTNIFFGEIFANMCRLSTAKVQKLFLVHAEKIDFKEIIQLRLTEKCDQRKMLITTLDSSSFQQLKQDQSLHVSFSGFVENLIYLLKECQSGKLNINLLELQLNDAQITCSDPNEKTKFQLQFVEVRPFKNLIHLSLPCHIAPWNIVLFHLNNILDGMQKKLLHQEETTQHLQHEINARDQKICNLEMENSKLKKIYSETTKNMQQKHSEQILELQERLKNSSEQRQQDNESNRIAIKNLQQKIDKLLEERSAIQTEKGQEQKRNEKLNEEISSLKGKIANLKEANDKCYNDLTVLKNVERKHEMHLQDFRKEINDLKEKLNNCEKDKAELMAELAAEKKISHTKRQALEIATDEISKANEIILKQSKELIKMKKILKWRTEVALQQEQTIKDNDTHIKQKNEQIVFLKQTVDSLRSAIPKELDSIRNSAAALEAKYSEHYIDKSIGAKFQADIFIHSKAIVISTIRKRTAGQG